MEGKPAGMLSHIEQSIHEIDPVITTIGARPDDWDFGVTHELSRFETTNFSGKLNPLLSPTPHSETGNPRTHKQHVEHITVENLPTLF